MRFGFLQAVYSGDTILISWQYYCNLPVSKSRFEKHLKGNGLPGNKRTITNYLHYLQEMFIIANEKFSFSPRGKPSRSAGNWPNVMRDVRACRARRCLQVPLPAVRRNTDVRSGGRAGEERPEDIGFARMEMATCRRYSLTRLRFWTTASQTGPSVWKAFRLRPAYTEALAARRSRTPPSHHGPPGGLPSGRTLLYRRILVPVSVRDAIVPVWFYVGDGLDRRQLFSSADHGGFSWL